MPFFLHFRKGRFLHMSNSSVFSFFFFVFLQVIFGEPLDLVVLQFLGSLSMAKALLNIPGLIICPAKLSKLRYGFFLLNFLNFVERTTMFLLGFGQTTAIWGRRPNNLLRWLLFCF